MKKTLKISTFRIQGGTKLKRGQGLHIAVTRRPPRGVPKARWTRDGYFDVWLPALAASAKLLARLKKHGRDFDARTDRTAFFESYERELLSSAEDRQLVEFLAHIAARTPISIGCFCADESRCHRSRLYKLILSHMPRE